MTKKNKIPEDYTGREFVITREFAAPRELVFQAWIDPKHLAQWWGPKGFTNPVCEWDARPGGKIYDVMRAPNGADYPMGGEFREIVPPSRLVLSCGALDEKGKMLFEFLHTATFTERKGKTRLTLNSRVLWTTAEANRYIGGFETGMTLSLERLADLLAKKNVPLIIERTFDAPAAKVWQALTRTEDIKRWSFDIKEFKPEVGFEFQLIGEKDGVKYVHHCKITAVVPGKKLAYTWWYKDYAGDSLVTFELFAEGDKTRLRLTHEGLETFPKIPAFARENFKKGWTHIVGSLKEFVEKNDDTSDREIIISRVFDAPRELVWEAWTNPKHVAQWWGPRGFTTTIEVMDVRPGGVWKQVMHGPDGTDYPNESVFTEVVKPERIVFTHAGAKKGSKVVNKEMRWIFEEQGKKTKLTIHQIYSSAAERDYIVREYNAIEGGKQTLERLAEHLAQARQRPSRRANPPKKIPRS